MRCGYRVAVHHGEDSLELIAGDADAELWLVGAHPWNYGGVRTEIQEIIRKGGAHCFTLRFSTGREEYDEHPFENMLRYLEDYRADGSLRVTTFETGRDLHDPLRNGVAEAKANWEREDAALANQIRALDEQIQAIYASWKEG